MAFKNISLPMLIGAVVVGLLAAFLSVVYLNYKERQLIARLQGPQTQKVQVVVASADLPKGTVLGAQNLAVRAIPSEYVHPDAVGPDSFEAIDGRILLQAMSKGRPLLQNFVAGMQAEDFSDTIASGRRAITIQVDELNAIGGHVRPGNHVDIYAMLPASLKEIDQEALSKLVLPVLQDVVVLATGERAYGEYAEKYSLQRVQQGLQPSSFTTLTLDVTPQQAALLTQAEEYGDLVALLRNRKDGSQADFAELSPSQLFLHAAKMQAQQRKRQQDRSVNGLRVTEDGRIFTKDGIEVTDPNIIVKDGVVMTKDGVVLSGTGMTIGADGKLRAADGSLVDTNNLELDNPVKVTKDGFLVNADGQVMTKDGKVLAGVTLNDKGEVVTADGQVLKEADLVVAADGSVTGKDGKVLAGISGSQQESGDTGLAALLGSGVEFLSGGNSKDGIALKGVIPVLGKKQTESAIDSVDNEIR